MPAIHPGEHLDEELQTLAMSAAELARNLGVPTNRITQILNGQRAITGDTALRLAHFFATSPEFWPNLQNLHDNRVSTSEVPESFSCFSFRFQSMVASSRRKKCSLCV